MARTKLTDKQKKKIIADYIECQNYSEVGRKWGITGTYVKKLFMADPSSSELLKDKKEQNTQDILAYLDSQTESLKRFGDYLLDDRLDPAKNKESLDGTPLRDLINAYGVMVDKTLKSKEIEARRTGEGRDIENLTTLAELLKKGD